MRKKLLCAFPAVILFPVLVLAQAVPANFLYKIGSLGTQDYPLNGYVLFDVDQDGYKDIVYLRSSALYRLAGVENSFTSPRVSLDSYLTNGSSDNDAVNGQGIALMDADDDGEQEIVYGRSGTTGLYKLDYNSSTSLYESNLIIAGTSLDGSYTILLPGYINADDREDLVVVGTYSSGGAYWFEQNSDGSYTKHTIRASAMSNPLVKLVDFDSDNDSDLVVASSDGNIHLFTNDGSGNFTETTPVTTLTSSRSFSNSYSSIDVGDVNNDTHKDIVVGSYSGSWASVFINNNDGTFSETVLRANASGSNGGVVVGILDVDGDGDIDITAGRPVVVSGVSSNTGISVFKNDNNTSFTAEQEFLPYSSSSLITAGLNDDLDGDGLTDFATSYNAYFNIFKTAFPVFTGSTGASVTNSFLSGQDTTTITLVLSNPYSATIRYNASNATLTDVTVTNNNTATVTITGAASNVKTGLASITYSGAYRGRQAMNVALTSMGSTYNVAVPIQLTSTSLAALPVVFTNFNAWEQGSGVMIEWTGLGEKNVSHYEVERSADARSFTTIGLANASNEYALETTYSHKDATPLEGDNYYRVVAVDMDGQLTYSPIMKVTLGNQRTAFALYPNPVTSYCMVQMPDAAGRTLLLQSATGITLRRIVVQPGVLQQMINTADLKPGIYFLTGHAGEVIKFTK